MNELLGRVRHGLSVEEFAYLYDNGALSLDMSATFSIAPSAFSGNRLAPRSDTYASDVMALWAALTGRGKYAAERDEAFALDPAVYLATPFPFSTGNGRVVGQYLGAVSWLLRMLDPAPGARVAELGAGWGHLSLALAMLGCDVVAVDLNMASVDLLRLRAERLATTLLVAQTPFTSYVDSDLDYVIFFEAFHHCDRPFELLDRCAAMIKPTGSIVFLSEAVYEDFYCPWGVRLDGHAAYMARHAGWLELGFRKDFFFDELRSRGLRVREFHSPDLGAYGNLIVATPGGKQPLTGFEENDGWQQVVGVPGFFSQGVSRISVESSEHCCEVEFELVNLCDAQLAVVLEAGATPTRLSVPRGGRLIARVEVPASQSRVIVRSQTGPSAALGLDRIGILVEEARR